MVVQPLCRLQQERRALTQFPSSAGKVAEAVSNGITLSTVVSLDASDRVDELARMISGDTVSDAAREAAKELLNG